jgi:hypothetical protein
MKSLGILVQLRVSNRRKKQSRRIVGILCKAAAKITADIVSEIAILP